MPRRADSSRLQRLDELAALLRADDLLTVGELAERLGVSQRTLTRDLDLLLVRGLPIDGSIGRGVCIRLHRHCSVGRSTLSYLEAIDLLVALAMAAKLGSSVLFKHVNPVRNKLALLFSPAERERI